MIKTKRGKVIVQIKTPKERVYYYECSHGKFRLVYFIPFKHLEDLVEKDGIKKQVLEDYPRGVDLRVREDDYVEFKKTYGYRPDLDPEIVKSTFFAMLSSTKAWKKYRGSGLISEKEIENQKKVIDSRIKKDKNEDLLTFINSPKTIKSSIPKFTPIRKDRTYKIDKMNLKNYYRLKKLQSIEQKKVDKVLEKIKPIGIDSKKDFRSQSFTPIEWTEGVKISKIFAEIQQKR